MGHEKTSLCADVASLLEQRGREVGVLEARIGLGYTAVHLDDGGAGMAYTFRREAMGGCCVFDGLRPLAGRRAADLLPLMSSDDRIEAAVGLACANALANRMRDDMYGGDVLERIEIRPDDHVAMVGNFGPLLESLRARARTLSVFEWIDEPFGDLLPARDAPRIIPECQVALITGTSILNHSIDGLLEAARPCRERVLLGASTPLLPEAFRERGPIVLSGVVARDPGAIMQVVSEGGGMRQFKRHVRKVNLPAPGP